MAIINTNENTETLDTTNLNYMIESTANISYPNRNFTHRKSQIHRISNAYELISFFHNFGFFFSLKMKFKFGPHSKCFKCSFF